MPLINLFSAPSNFYGFLLRREINIGICHIFKNSGLSPQIQHGRPKQLNEKLN